MKVVAKASSKRVVYAALIGNLLVAATKSLAAAWTGSSAMLSEAVHSFIDTGNEILLLYGMGRAAHRADVEHPLGYGRELYFWSFIVALLVFALGAGVSIYEGIGHIRSPEAISDLLVVIWCWPWHSYLVAAPGSSQGPLAGPFCARYCHYAHATSMQYERYSRSVSIAYSKTAD